MNNMRLGNTGNPGSGEEGEATAATVNEEAMQNQSVLMRLTALYELGRYFLLSFVALGTDIGLFYLLVEIIGVPYLIANPISVLAGLAVIYLGSIYWVFRHRAVKNRLLEFVTFCAIGVGGLLVNQMALWVFVEWLLVVEVVAKGMAAICSFLFNFVMRKLLLFS